MITVWSLAQKSCASAMLIFWAPNESDSDHDEPANKLISAGVSLEQRSDGTDFLEEE